MKKYLLVFLFSILSLNCFAGWVGSFDEDSYSGERIPMVNYEICNSQKDIFIQYKENLLCVICLYNALENFDLWWDIRMDYKGKMRRYFDVDLNFIGKSHKECNFENQLGLIGADLDSNLSIVFGIEDEDGELLRLLKANNKLNIRYYDEVKDQTSVINISLAGFTAQAKKVGL